MRRRAFSVFLMLLLAGGALAYFGGVRLPDLAFLGDNDLRTPEAESRPDLRAANTPEADVIAALAPRPGASRDQPKFDIARIDPEGASVFAGRAAPNAVVTVLENGNPVGSVTADENGEWALTVEHKFASADPKLTLEARPDGASGPVAVAGNLAGHQAASPSARAAAAPSAVAQRLLQDLEDMVADARREAADKTIKPPDSKAARAESRETANISPPPGKRGTVPAAGKTETWAPLAPGARSVEIAAAPAGEARAPPPAALVSAPIPITFVYREAAFTDDGGRAVSLLLEYLKLKKLPSVSLSGHADEIGGDVYNMALSKERLDAVSRFLRSGGFEGRLNLVPKGKSEPFSGVDRSRLTAEEARQLDRRVELRLAR